MRAYIITDGYGYFVKVRRGRDKKPIFLWSPKKSDAGRMAMLEVAEHFAAMMAQPVKILETR